MVVLVVLVLVLVGGRVSCEVGWKGGVLLLGGTLFAVETWARKGRRNAGGERERGEDDWMKARRMIGASIFFFSWALVLLLRSSPCSGRSSS